MPSTKTNKTMSSFSRARQIRAVVKKYGLTKLVSDLELPKPLKFGLNVIFGSPQNHSQARGECIRLALEELGPVFVKLGQALSTRPDLLPEDISIELAKLQDQVPAFPAEESMQIIRNAYGESLDSIFASIDPQPLASASVAQVHCAKLRPGLAITGQNKESTDEVVIKVLRPGIEQLIESDLKVMYRVAGFLQKYWSRGPQFRPLDVIREYDLTIHDELDLRVEAANGARMGAHFEDSDLIYVPRIYWDYTSTQVLVMERIHGVSIRDIDRLRKLDIDFEKLAADGVGVFFHQAFEHNFFHADMHAGNIFVSDVSPNKGQWIAIDFGIMGSLEEQDKQYLATMLLGFFNRDYATIAEAHIRAGWVPEGTSPNEFEQAIRIVCEPIFAKPLSEISFGNVLMQLFQTVRRFEMPVQPQLVLLYKTLLNIEGLGRQLYPDLNLWDTAKPFLEDWMKRQHSPQKLIEDFTKDLPRWKEAIQKLPNAIEQLAQQNQSATDAKPSKVSTLSSLGLAVSILSMMAISLNQIEIIQLSSVENALPFLAMAGLGLALWQR